MLVRLSGIPKLKESEGRESRKALNGTTELQTDDSKRRGI